MGRANRERESGGGGFEVGPQEEIEEERERERGTITQVDESSVPGNFGLLTYLRTYQGLKAFNSWFYFDLVNRVP